MRINWICHFVGCISHPMLCRCCQHEILITRYPVIFKFRDGTGRVIEKKDRVGSGTGIPSDPAGEPRNGPELHFFFKDPIFIWEKGNLGALSLPGASLLLGENQKVYVLFRPPGARKTARFGRAEGKIKLSTATAPKFWSFYPLESSGLMKKRLRYKNQLSPSNEAVLMGWCVTACAEAGRLENYIL